MTREEAWRRTKGYLYDALSGEEADEIIKTLEQEPYTKVISCEDTLKLIYNFKEKYIEDREKHPINYGTLLDLLRLIRELPPITSQPKYGKWIQTNEFFINQDGQFIYKFICSECKSLSYFRKSNKKAIGANVCPNCGAKMVEREEYE